MTTANKKKSMVLDKKASKRFADAVTIARKTGLLKSARTKLVRGRMLSSPKQRRAQVFSLTPS